MNRAAAALLALMLAPPAAAQSWPDKPVRVVVPLATGGTTDILARMLGQHLGETLRQSFIVDNRPGGGGNIGNEIVARARPDGYTLLMASPPLVINPSLERQIAYDPVRDYAAITLVASIPIVFAVHPAVAARSVKELIALARSKPGALTYASSGVGGSPHLAAALFTSMANVDITHVPYKGSGPALTDLLGGQVHMQFSGLPPLLPHIRTGKLRALAVGGATRTGTLPDVATLAEAGVPGYEATSWQGLAAPARTPRAIVQQLNTLIVTYMRRADARARLAELGADPVGSSPEQFAAFLNAEFTKWASVIRKTGARVE